MAFIDIAKKSGHGLAVTAAVLAAVLLSTAPGTAYAQGAAGMAVAEVAAEVAAGMVAAEVAAGVVAAVAAGVVAAGVVAAVAAGVAAAGVAVGVVAAGVAAGMVAAGAGVAPTFTATILTMDITRITDLTTLCTEPPPCGREIACAGMTR